MQLGSFDRYAFRRHALDGAALFFQPATGVQVRVATEATRQLRRQAPRVAMFGITNACNLRCEFCSRDVARPSEWTVASAAAALRGLAEAGTLEVAYGGGEPFAFRGFAELVAELHETTLLAQHVTTNGTLIDDARWAAFAGRFGQVRLSIHEGTPWRPAAETLAGYGQLWGANVLVDAAALPGLPGLFDELAALGCRDVSLLSYVGPERARQLDGQGAARLAELIGEAPLACRLSVCFGDRVAVPRLPTGDMAGDCGAGRDFLSITPDRRVQSCSFQERSLPGATAEEILAAWRLEQAMLAAPSPRSGCARLLPMAREAEVAPPIAIWRGFSGNNSGECAMVATFRTAEEAEAYLAELLPGWLPDEDDYSAAWKQLFADEGVAVAGRVPGSEEWYDCGAPRELARLGRTVMAVKYGLDDTFPELRALAWKRGGQIPQSGIHMHSSLTLVMAVRCRGDADRAKLLAAPTAFAALHRHAHGELVLATLPLLGGAGGAKTLDELRDEALRLADGRPLGAELYLGAASDTELVAAKQRLGQKPAACPRLWISFWGQGAEDKARALAGVLDGEGGKHGKEPDAEGRGSRVTVAGGVVLVDPAPDRKRLAVLAYRHGGTVSALDGEQLLVSARIWYLQETAPRGQPRPPKRVVDAAHLESALRATLPREAELTVKAERGDPSIYVRTAEPAVALARLSHYARSVEARLLLWCSEPEALELLLHRVVANVGP